MKGTDRLASKREMLVKLLCACECRVEEDFGEAVGLRGMSVRCTTSYRCDLEYARAGGRWLLAGRTPLQPRQPSTRRSEGA